MVYQDSNDVEQTAQLSLGSGAAITVGTADPTGGSVGDAYIKRNATDVIISIWLNLAGGWAEYTLPAGGTGGTITTESPISGDGSAADPATIINHAISHLKLGSTVAGVNEPAGRITEADGAGGMRWTNKGGGATTALDSIDFPTPDATNVYDVIDHLGVLYRNLPVLITGTVAWAASGDGDDVSDLWGEQTGTYRFRGIQATSGVSSPQSGDVVLLPAGGFRHRGATRWSHLSSPQGWVGGPYANKAEADNHATALNDVSAFDNALQLVTTFVAGTTEYAWYTGDDPAFLVSRVLGTPTVERLYEIQNFLGELYRVEPRPSGHLVTWDDYALLSDVSALWGENAGTYRWRGETYPSGVTNPATGDVIKEPAGHFRHRNSSNAWVHLADPDDFIGDYNDETAADNHVTAVGQTSLYSHLLHQVATFTAGVAVYVWAKGLDAREVTVDAHAFGGNLATTDTDIQLVADKVDGLILGPSISDDDPEDIGATANAGVSGEVLPKDHAHRLPTDNTLEFNANDELAVNIHDVIERVGHHIRYYTNVNDYSSSAGASVGQVFTTSRYKKVITKIEADFNPLGGADEYLIRLDEVEDNNDIKTKLAVSNTRSTAGGTAGVRSFRFHDGAGEPGVTINGGINLGVLLSRLGDNSDSATQAVHGAEAANSPAEDYDDASLDFVLVNDVVYQHINPGVGTSTHSHGTDIRCNFKIYYTVIIDHGHLLGDGSVNAAHINSGSAPDGEVLTADGAGGASWEAASGDGGGGSGGGYGDWASIGSVTGAISGNPVTVALNANETIDDYEELYLHIEANDTNDQRVVSGRFRVSDIPTTTLAGGGLGIPFAGNNTDEGAVLVRRNAAGDSLVLDAFGSVINFPATAVTSIRARELTAGGGGGAGTDDQTAAEVPVTATGFTGNLSATDTDVQAALDTIDGLSLGGGGGGATPDRIVLADAVGVSNTAGPHEIALTEAMVARQWLTFFAFTTTGASPDGIGYLLSDDILALTAEATAPTDAENALPVVQASYSASNFSQQSGNYFVYRKDDSTLWVRPTRLAAHSLTITATPMGGGGTGAQLSGGLTEQVIVGSRLATTEYGLGTLWTGVVDAISPTISPAINPDNLLQVAVGLRIDTEAAPELIISGAGIRRMTHTSDPLPSTAVSSDEIPGAYYSARVSRNNEDRVIEINPTLSWMEKRREAGRYGILFAFTENAAGNLSSIRPFVSAAVEIDIEYIVAIVGA